VRRLEHENSSIGYQPFIAAATATVSRAIRAIRAQP